MCANGFPNHYVCQCDCTGFGVGAKIIVTNPGGSTINVRDAPAGAVLGQAPNGAQGVIIGGPVEKDLAGMSEVWWQVDFAGATVDGWVVQRLVSLIGPVNVVTDKNLDVCVAKDVDLIADCTDRVQPALLDLITTQVPPQTQCTCTKTTDILPYVDECNNTCDHPSGVCLLAGSDPATPTPDPLPAAVFATTSVCEVTGQAEIHVGDEVKTPGVSGFVQIHGRPCLPGQPCSVGISYQVEIDPITFEVRFASDPTFVDLGVSGATEPAVVNLVPLGGLHVGQIPTAASLNTLRGRRSGSTTNIVTVQRNGAPLGIAIDWTGKHCLIDGEFVNTAGGGVVDGETTQPIRVLMTLGGQTDTLSRIVNQPPRPNAGADQTVECTSPQGALVKLDASLSTDPDSNIAFFVWRRDSETGPQVADPLFAPTLRTQQALGETTYHLRVVDGRLAADNTSVKVRVVDSTPPALDCQAPPVIPKQDTPIAFAATTEDTCGSSGVVVENFECFKIAPEGRIKDNPSCKGSIQGGTLTIGNSAGADLIRWTILATDASGNPARKTCEVSVSP
jgi:hypothetical protein